MISEITKSRNKSDALMEVLVFVLNLLISTFIRLVWNRPSSSTSPFSSPSSLPWCVHSFPLRADCPRYLKLFKPDRLLTRWIWWGKLWYQHIPPCHNRQGERWSQIASYTPTVYESTTTHGPVNGMANFFTLLGRLFIQILMITMATMAMTSARRNIYYGLDLFLLVFIAGLFFSACLVSRLRLIVPGWLVV